MGENGPDWNATWPGGRKEQGGSPRFVKTQLTEKPPHTPLVSCANTRYLPLPPWPWSVFSFLLPCPISLPASRQHGTYIYALGSGGSVWGMVRGRVEVTCIFPFVFFFCGPSPDQPKHGPGWGRLASCKVSTLRRREREISDALGATCEPARLVLRDQRYPSSALESLLLGLVTLYIDIAHPPPTSCFLDISCFSVRITEKSPIYILSLYIRLLSRQNQPSSTLTPNLCNSHHQLCQNESSRWRSRNNYHLRQLGLDRGLNTNPAAETT